MLPGLIGITDEPTPSIQMPSADGNQIISPTGVNYSNLLQLHNHVKTEQSERTTFEQLVQCLQRDFALLQPQTAIIYQLATSKPTSQTELEKKEKNEKHLCAEIYQHNSHLNSLQN